MTNIAEVNFDGKGIYQGWKQVREDFWGDLKIQCAQSLKRLLEGMMEIEVQDLVGARRGEHSRLRRTYRNGCYYRDLLSGFGYLSGIRVPRVREGQLRVLPRYQSRTPDVDEAILKMFLAGVSTRRVEEAIAPLWGKQAVSAATVSRISQRLDQDVRRFHQRPLKDDYAYLFLDGVYINAKSPFKKRRRCVLVAYAMTTQGRREIVDFQLASQGESENAWEGFLNGLWQRGLQGQSLRLVVSDGNRGLRNAVGVVYPNAKKQLCWAHKLRNVANALPKRHQALCLGEARAIYQAESVAEALRTFRAWASRWRSEAPKAVACLERDWEELIAFWDCPRALWKKTRTTNAIERCFREVRRRTNPMSCFTNPRSVERILYAIFYRMNKIWEKRLPKITQKN